MMRLERMGVALVLAVGLAALSSCVEQNEAAPAAGSPEGTVKGGDDRTGGYQVVENWWKAAPDHQDGWTWGQVSGLAVDSPDRIIVAVWGDQNAEGVERPGGSNYLVVADGDGNIVERWTQWDSILNRPHQVYISPYDPERHVWVVERGGGRGVPMSVLKFTNDGSQLVMRLFDPAHPKTRDEARANPNPGPYAYGDPAVLAFLPDGSFLLGDGYWNSRIVKYNAAGEYVMEWGKLGSGPGQFDLVHGVAVDREGRIYTADRNNNRIQVFTESGEFIEEWPDIKGPTGIYIDERENAWVLSTTLNQILEFNLNGELQYQFGAYCCTRGGFVGGFSRPHQMVVDNAGNLYVANYDGGYVTKYTPRPGADPNRLVGGPLVLEK